MLVIHPSILFSVRGLLVLFGLLSTISACGWVSDDTKQENASLTPSGKTFADRCEAAESGGKDSSETTFYAVSGRRESPFRNVAVLKLLGGNICSAVLVAPDRFITAAHCFEDSRELVSLEFIDRADGFSEPLSVSGVVLHPDYEAALAKGKSLDSNPGLASFDVAIIHLERKITDRIASTITGESFSSGSLVALVGYGDAGRGAGSKRFAQSHVGRIVQSETVAGEEFRNLMLLDSKSGAGACPGDSGGGLFVRSGDEYLLAGVVNGMNDVLYPGYPISECGTCPQGLGVVTLLSGHKNFLNTQGI